MADSQTPAPRQIDADTIRRGMHYSTLEGIFAVQYVTLTSATLLVGFLLALGATSAQVGLVAMFPLLNGLLQPLGAAFIHRRGGWRKGVTLSALLIDDGLWLISLCVALLLPGTQAIVAIIAVLALQQFVNAFNIVAWTSWISDLIPASLRGRYFGRRNFICNGLGAITAVLAGQFIEHIGHDAVWSFAVVIGIGMAFRLVSGYFLRKQPEPFPDLSLDLPLRQQFTAPFEHQPFRRYMVFSMLWGFAVQFSAPFFAVYMIRDLQIDFGLVALFAGLTTIANLLGQRFWGPLCDRYGNQPVMRLTALIIVFQPFWWLFAAKTGWGFYLIPVLHASGGFAWSGYLLGNFNLMVGLAPETGKTPFFGVAAALTGVFSAIAPLSAGVLADFLTTQSFAVPAWLPYGLPTLFLLSFALRFGAWGLLQRIREPVRKPRLHVTYLIRDAVRSLSITQGFNPLLHTFTIDMDEDDITAQDVLNELMERND